MKLRRIKTHKHKTATRNKKNISTRRGMVANSNTNSNNGKGYKNKKKYLNIKKKSQHSKHILFPVDVL